VPGVALHVLEADAPGLPLPLPLPLPTQAAQGSQGRKIRSAHSADQRRVLLAVVLAGNALGRILGVVATHHFAEVTDPPTHMYLMAKL
jgi:hypothetical protein